MMAYEKLLNEIYAAISLEYLWPEYRPFFVKSESPDWINEGMDLGLEVSQALLPEDGPAESFIEKYLCKQSFQLILSENGNAQLLCFCKFAAGIFTGQQIIGLFGNRARHLSTVTFDESLRLFSGKIG